MRRITCPRHIGFFKAWLLGIALALGLTVSLAGCATQYVPPAGYAPAPGSSMEDCTIAPWLAVPGPVHLRQTVFLDFLDDSRVLQGVMVLDQEEIRLVGMTEFGIKLFDLIVTRQDHDLHFLSAALGRKGPVLVRMVADSVRRIFLPPLLPPDTNDAKDAKAFHGPRGLLIVHRLDSRSCMVHECEPASGRVTKTFSPRQRWEVSHDRFQTANGFELPRLITYQDRRAGYSLVLEVHEVYVQ